MKLKPPNFRVSTDAKTCANCQHMYTVVAWKQQLDCTQFNCDTHPTLVCDAHFTDPETE